MPIFSKTYNEENRTYIYNILGIKIKHTTKGKNNKIYIEKNGKLSECKKIKGLKIKLVGNNNTVIIGKPYNFEKSKIYIMGDNNEVIIESTKYTYRELFINLNVRRNIQNRKVHIKKDCAFERTTIQCFPSNATLTIGEDCMVSFDVKIYTGDVHQIFDKNTGELLNAGGSTEIGNHVWIGHDVSIGKNVIIPNNTIIGFNSVVTRKYDEEYTAIAGCPAKVVKRNLVWDRNMEF